MAEGEVVTEDRDIVAWLIGVVFVVAILGAVFGALQNAFNTGQLGIVNTAPLTADTPLGARVQTVGETEVWTEAGGLLGSGELLGEQPKGAKGKTLAGPKFFENGMWWSIDFDNGVDGWVLNDDLEILLDAQLELGDSIIVTLETDVWAEAERIDLLGTQMIGSIGELINGPIIYEQWRWWDVDFREGVDGWVSEESLTIRPSFWSRSVEFLRTAGVRISLVISLVLLTGIVYATLRVNRVRKKENTVLKVADDRAFASKSVVNDKWLHVLELVDSENQNDWRAAIIEADIMLDELVSTMTYTGENLGEKLKGIEKSDFTTIDQAWEAHKVRNRIAHSGSDFILTQREARRVVDLFKQVFDEFDYI